MPFLVVIGVLCAVVAIPLAVVGRRAARSGARGASMATSALVLGILALPLAVLGAVLTAVVLDMVQPGAHTVTGEECRSNAGRATFSGSVTNLTDEEQSYTVFVQFTRAGTSSIIGDDTVSVDDVAPGATGPFVASIGTDVDDVDCEVIDVLGGLPFSID